MLFYLDNWQPSRLRTAPTQPRARRPARLDENYGRELLELHTLGVDGGYTQNDVTEVGALLHGLDHPAAAARRSNSSSTSACTTRARRPCWASRSRPAAASATARRCSISWRSIPPRRTSSRRDLAIRFVADEPPAALVDRMAETFRKTDGDLRAVMKTMLEAGVFRRRRLPLQAEDPARDGGQRRPRGNGDHRLRLPAGQPGRAARPRPCRKQEPTGYSNSSMEWLNSGGLLARIDLHTQLDHNKCRRRRSKRRKARQESRRPVAGIALGSPEFQKR